MFTDTEIGLAIRHGSEMRAFAGEAQTLVSEMDRDIRTLRRKLAAANAEIANLKLDAGRRAIDDLRAIRALKRRAAN